MPQTLKHIMCIDDEIDILDIVQITLETIGGYQISICTSGKEAVEKVTQINPDLILLDVMMPGLDGPATLRQLRLNEAVKNLPIIFMTAKAQSKEVAQYTEMGALGVITKPFDPMKLAQQVQELWEKNH